MDSGVKGWSWTSSQLDTTSGGDGGTADPGRGSHLITYLDRVHSSGLSDGICFRNNQVNKNPLQGRTLQLESAFKFTEEAK